MAAAYLFHLVANHPFIDGNKRTGAVCSFVFLSLNGMILEADEEEFEELVWGVARGELQKNDVARFFEENCRLAD